MSMSADHPFVNCQGTLLRNESLSKYTSWRVGGPATLLYKPANLPDLISFISQLPATEPLLWLGLGSNTLVRDAGIDHTVIITQGALMDLAVTTDEVLRAEAGLSCAQVARFAARQGFKGAEFFAGIPGTLGGALTMNAGAFGGETWSHVQVVETINRQGQRFFRQPSAYQIGYRSVTGPTDEWFVAAHFKYPRGDAAAAFDHIKTLLARRNQTQPTNYPSCGSVFRNPVGDHAARLIQACGLKGMQYGAAAVSDKHANFIINLGAATATEIEYLIEHVRAAVNAQFNIKLELEARIVG